MNTEKKAADAIAVEKDDKTKQKHSVKELTDTLQRLQADFDNYKKRVDKEKQQVAVMAKATVIQRLLPVIDAFEIAAKTDAGDQLKKGMALIQSELTKVMHSLEMKPIEAVGKKCNPHKHEVLMQELREDCEDDTITEELQKGYTLGDIILRTSKVKVARKINDQHEKNTKEHATQ